jgi:acetyl esterase/lipase
MNGWLVAGATMGLVLAMSGRAGAEVLPLWPDTPPGETHEDAFRPTLTTFLLEGDEARGAVVVVPGGGYGGRADHEREPIARRFNEAGFHAFVLDYRVAPHRNPEPLNDAARAVRIVRNRAAEWRVKPDKIAVLGFSAGGHLTASLGVFFDSGEAGSSDPVARESSRPDALVLCYPVISSGKFGHQGSFDNLLGPESSAAEREAMSLEKHVRKDTPPAFLWSTSDDEAVPVENSLLFATALRAQGIPFEMHVYPHGPHGMGLAEKDPHVGTWPELCAEWLKGMDW